MSKIKSIFLTGANRGIGLQLVKEIVPKLQPQHLFATFRNVAQAKELHDFAKSNPCIHLVQMDVRDDSKFDEVTASVNEATGGEGLSMLINNAGITSKYAKLHALKKEQLLENFQINTVAPILLAKSFIHLIEKAADSSSEKSYGIGRASVINISSILGSVSANDNGGMYPYRCSKSALNAATRSMSFDLRRHKILCVAVHPGWAQTDMGGPKAPITAEQSAKGIVSLLEALNESHNGGFYQYDGSKLEW